MKEAEPKLCLNFTYIAIFIAVIAFIGLSIMCTGSRKRSFFKCEEEVATNIMNFKQAIFSDAPILMLDAKNIYYPMELEKLLFINYNIDKKFKYSPIFIIIQQNKDVFSHLRQQYKLLVAHKYVGFESKYYQASYAVVINNETNPILDNSILLPLIMERICIDKIEVNGKPLLDILGISPEGFFIDKMAEKEFLKTIDKLQAE